MTDNARELCMGEMKEICEESGIQLNTSVYYSPESDGAAERTIGVLTSAPQSCGPCCTTLAFENSCGFLWAEAFSTATYARNRRRTKALALALELGRRTLYEVLYGAKPNVSHLRPSSRRAKRVAEEAEEAG